MTLSHWNSSGAMLQPCVLPQWNTDREQLAVRHPGTSVVQIFDSFLAAPGSERFQRQIGNPPPPALHTHHSSISGSIIDKDSHSGMTLIAAPKPFEKWFACHFSCCCPLYDAHVSRKTTRPLIQKELGWTLNGRKLVYKFFSFFPTWNNECN